MSVERMCVILQPAAVSNVLNQLDCSEEREIYNDRFAASQQGFIIESEHIREAAEALTMLHKVRICRAYFAVFICNVTVGEVASCFWNLSHMPA